VTSFIAKKALRMVIEGVEVERALVVDEDDDVVLEVTVARVVLAEEAEGVVGRAEVDKEDEVELLELVVLLIDAEDVAETVVLTREEVVDSTPIEIEIKAGVVVALIEEVLLEEDVVDLAAEEDEELEGLEKAIAVPL